MTAACGGTDARGAGDRARATGRGRAELPGDRGEGAR